MQSGDLLVYITDFLLNGEDQRQASVVLQQLKANGVMVVFIAMFKRHAGDASGLSYVECRDIKDLASLTLTSI